METFNNKELDKFIFEIANGKKDALASIYERTNKKVYGFILSMLGNKYDAEDVLHDTYVMLFKAAPKYQSSGKPLSWIMGVARNQCLIKLRERKHDQSVPFEDYEETLDAMQQEHVEDKICLEDFLNILSQEEREIIYLYVVAGFKHREIANITNLNLATVLSKYHRAIKKLRKEYEKGDL